MIVRHFTFRAECRRRQSTGHGTTLCRWLIHSIRSSVEHGRRPSWWRCLYGTVLWHRSLPSFPPAFYNVQFQHFNSQTELTVITAKLLRRTAVLARWGLYCYDRCACSVLRLSVCLSVLHTLMSPAKWLNWSLIGLMLHARETLSGLGAVCRSDFQVQRLLLFKQIVNSLYPVFQYIAAVDFVQQFVQASSAKQVMPNSP